MRIAYSTNAFVKRSLADALRAVKALGFDAVEIVADAPHLFVPDVLRVARDPSVPPRDRRGGKTGKGRPPSAAAAPVVREVAALLAELALPVCNVNANTARGTSDAKAGWTLSDPKTDSRLHAVRCVCGAVEIAAALGAPSVSVAGGPAAAHAKPAEGRMLFLDSLTHVIRRAKDQRVRIGIEAEPGQVIGCTDDVEWCLTQLPDFWLGANLDIGHCVVAGENPVKSIRKLAGRIWNVHVEDIRGREHFHLVPGTGEIDFKAIVAALAAAKYDGCLTLELYTYPDAPEEAGRNGLQHLRALVDAQIAGAKKPAPG
ncbi:MAG: sugar phosphate isomerase/epimerase [Planctomycetota bacterium]|nr:sugar phosphate isomerase/epimerase [Planctomycetota bacterium]